MSKWSFLLIAIFCSCAFVHLAVAQEASPNGASEPAAGTNVLGSVVNGNTTIVFEAANPTDLDSQQLQTWGEFAEAHPRVANALAYKPTLINDQSYLSKHPELDTFLQQHPDIRNAMVENPGNFNAIPPRPGE